MASVPMRYIFYGGVEGVHQLTDSDLNGADYGAKAFGFAEGAPITGQLTFSGDAYEIVENSYPQPPLTASEIPPGTEGLAIFLQMPRMGPPLFGLTEENLIIQTDPDNTTFLFALPDNLDGPLAQLGFLMQQNEDGAGVDVDARYIRFADDDDAMAEAYGVWMPEHVKVDVRVGTDGADNIKGGKDWNFLYGLGGDDKLTVRNGEDGWAWGGTGNDTLNGGSGEDFLSGGDGDDSIEGGSGDDAIVGGWGNDTLRGGGGKDDFHLRDFDGNDVILNFQRGQDQIYFTVSDPLDFQSLLASAVYADGNTTLTYFQGATVTLVGLSPGQLSAGDFVFN